MLARDLLLDVLASEGTEYIFGNPGTTELPLLQALGDRSKPEYILGLQESSCVAMADGYALASGNTAFVNLHATCGLGNGLGNLANAVANETPMVVTAGQQDTRHLLTDPLLSGDACGLAAPLTKSQYEVRHPDELGMVLRRAYADAATTPTGPVFISLPMNVLDMSTDVDTPAPIQRVCEVLPSDEIIHTLALELAKAASAETCIVAADEVIAANAVNLVVDLAETLGVRVYGAPLHGGTVFPPSHALWAGPLRDDAAGIRKTLERYGLVLYLGGQAFKTRNYTEGSPLPRATALIHISADRHQLGRTVHAKYAIAGSLLPTLQGLIKAIRPLRDTAESDAALERARLRRAADDRSRVVHVEALSHAIPLQPELAVATLLDMVPDETPIVDETITSGKYVRRHQAGVEKRRFFMARGGGLGWAMPASVGVSLAYRDAPVLCLIGDGSAMYSPQALWSAARNRRPILFVVFNNGQYRILRDAMRSMYGADSTHASTSLDVPALDFAGLARSMGVAAARPSNFEEFRGLVAAWCNSPRPYLLDVRVTD